MIPGKRKQRKRRVGRTLRQRRLVWRNEPLFVFIAAGGRIYLVTAEYQYGTALSRVRLFARDIEVEFRLCKRVRDGVGRRAGRDARASRTA